MVLRRGSQARCQPLHAARCSRLLAVISHATATLGAHVAIHSAASAGALPAICVNVPKST
jgi:hypothetical protein